jgi:HNH endonuclease
LAVLFLDGEYKMKLLPLTQGYLAMVADEDYERLRQYKWRLSKNQENKLYAKRAFSQDGWVRQVYLHHEVLGMISPPRGYVVDHINGNGLDCRRENLRLCTQAQNLQNKPPKKNSRSRYKGVTIYESKKGYRYYARITKNRKTHCLGKFKDEYTAMAMYNAWSYQLFGRFAYLNTWTGPSIAGEPDPLAEELKRIPYRDEVPYPHDPSERFYYVWKLPEGKRSRPQGQTPPETVERKLKHSNKTFLMSP